MPEINSTVYVVDPTTGDITETSRKTLGDYLSSKTNKNDSFTTPYGDTVQIRGGGNPGSGIGYGYLPPRPNSFYVTSNSSEVGADASTQLPTVAQPRFAYPDAVNKHTQQAYDDLRNLEKLEPSSGRSNGEVSPNDLISNRGNESFPGDLAVPEKTKTKIRSSVLMKNRFTEEGKFVPKENRDKSSPRVEEPGTGNLFRSYAEPDRGVSRGDRSPQYLRSTFTGATGTEVDGAGSPVSAFKLMRERGLISVLNASGYRIKSFDDFEGREDTPDSITNRYLFIGGSIVDTATGGKIVDMSEVTPAIDMFTSPTDDPDMGNPETKINNRSYGVLNNYLDRFSGGGSDRAVVVALLLYVSLFVAIAIVSAIFSLIGGIARPDPTIQNYPMGAERGADFGDIFSGGSFVENLQITLAKLLNINLPYESGVASIGRYFLNAIEGAASLIGLDIDDFGGDAASLSSGLGNAVEVILNLAFASGYYLTLIRAICRDLSLIGQAANDIGSPLGFVDFINKMRDARIVRITDSCASVGEKNRQRRLALEQSPNTSAMLPSNDPENEDPSLRSRYRVSRSRVDAGGKELSWSHRQISAMSSELLSADLFRVSSIRTVNQTGKVTPTNRKEYLATGGRIDDATRATIEQALESEYVPFYFHDLRTNEILAFHAFLGDLTDGFTSNYTQSTGFGRMDPVQTYGSTTRSISFSFNIVSTSPDDFDEMWYSINKLVNMCYPQWSEGTYIEDQKNKFIQPFSQVIASSPMIRVRIGDVIHSNYDRFGLAQLFGLGKFESKLNDQKYESTLKKEKEIERFKNELIISPATTANVTLYNATLAFQTIEVEYTKLKGGPEQYYKLDATDVASIITTGNIPTDKKAELFVIGEFSEYRSGKIAGFIPNNTNPQAGALILVEVTSVGSRYGGGTISGQAWKYQVIDPKRVQNNPDIADTIILPSNQTEYEVEVSTFMDPINNPIVRSFEQASGGKGLAGFITQLGFDWNESTWETGEGSRAPKYLKVSVQFAPIHDIPMGLASDGTARTVAYPVGRLSREKYFPNIKKRE